MSFALNLRSLFSGKISRACASLKQSLRFAKAELALRYRGALLKTLEAPFTQRTADFFRAKLAVDYNQQRLILLKSYNRLTQVTTLVKRFSEAQALLIYSLTLPR